MSHKTTKWCSFCGSDIAEPELSISMAAYEAFWRHNRCYVCNHISLSQPKNETEATRIERELKRELQNYEAQLQNYKTQLQKKTDEANERKSQSEKTTQKTLEKIKEILEKEHDRKYGGGLYEQIRLAEQCEREDQLKEIVKQALEESDD
jgi:hypothetical protein